MRIAVIGWGSLVWQPSNDHGELLVASAARWQPDGPLLPIEFARISSDGRLTLVIVPGHRPLVPALWIESAFDDLEAAVANLARRETGAPATAIHAHDGSAVANGDPHPETVDAIGTWLLDRQDIDAAIWTGLPQGARWIEHGVSSFTPDAAIAYIRSLTGDVRGRASEYILRAPAQVATGLRKRLEEALAENR